MSKHVLFRATLIAFSSFPFLLLAQNNIKKSNYPIAIVASGTLEGTYNAARTIETFKGIPFAAPPIGSLRWKAPQPVKNWKGVRQANQFGPRAMQKPIFDDMRFRSNGVSEDCLYLNVWAPIQRQERLPVLVYFYGGGFIGGDGSEYRYDGERMASKGIITVTVNYRLGIFGFLAHSQLTAEAPYHGSGNYGLLDQQAALQWVFKNIAAFGGDPSRITIGGESAGSISVFVQMASPLSKNLIHGAIGESGAMIAPTFAPIPLHEGEEKGALFLKKTGYTTISALRKLSAEKVLALDSLTDRFPVVIDGYLLPKAPTDLFLQKKQAQVPLLLGWNSGEGSYEDVLSGVPTPENYRATLKKVFGTRYQEALTAYPGNNKSQIIRSASDLAADRFIVYSTWKWSQLQLQNTHQPVYRYLFSRIRLTKAQRDQPIPVGTGATHSSEIEYALGNLNSNPVYDWDTNDQKVSETMERYFANFIKTGSPNGEGLVRWDPLENNGTQRYLNIDTVSMMKASTLEDRYKFLEDFYKNRRL